MTESYSRWNLTIFKPWRESVDNLKVPYATFAEAFVNFYEDNLFPGKKRAELLRARLRINTVDIDDGGDIAIGDTNTPTEKKIILFWRLQLMKPTTWYLEEKIMKWRVWLKIISID